MGQNLTGQLISNTYQNLVQKSGSVFTDGLGNNITLITVTASFASQAGTAGYAITAGTAGYAPTAGTAGFADQAGTAGFASQAGTSGFSTQAGTAGFATSASYAVTASFALNVTPIFTGSFLNTASIVDATTTYTKADGSTFALTTNNVNNAISASFATTASYALNATPPFPYTGVASISGSLQVTGSATIKSASFNGDLIDNLTTPTASDAVKHVVALSETDYNNLASPDPNTFYIINDVTGSLVLGDTIVSGSLTVTGTLNAPGLVVPSASYAQTASVALRANNGFPYSGSAEITGSLTIDPVSDTSNALVINGGRINLSTGNYVDTIWFNVGNSNNTFSTTAKSPVMSLGASITNNSEAHGVAFGENHSISNTGYNTFIGGGNGNSIPGANKAAIIAGTSNTVNNIDSAILAGSSNTVSHDRSVILGGSGLATTKADEAVVEKFTIAGTATDVFVISNYASLNYADDTAAAAGGVPLGGVYRNGNFLMIRIS
jgi:hypothetical protein